MTGKHAKPVTAEERAAAMDAHTVKFPPRPGEHRFRPAPEKTVWCIPADGPRPYTRAEAELLMFGWHTDHQHDRGCCNLEPAAWNCPGFVAARIRGMHHTMYVVPMPYDKNVTIYQRWAILDLIDDAGCELREGFDGYYTALLFAAARCATEIANETGQ
jgi:hypothetical protein